MTNKKVEYQSAEEFWAVLERHGIQRSPLDKFSAAGRVRHCKKFDGQSVCISVYDQYPIGMADKVLEEYGLVNIPLYNSNLN